MTTTKTPNPLKSEAIKAGLKNSKKDRKQTHAKMQPTPEAIKKAHDSQKQTRFDYYSTSGILDVIKQMTNEGFKTYSIAKHLTEKKQYKTFKGGNDFQAITVKRIFEAHLQKR